MQGPFIIVTLVLLWLAYLILDPTPPRTVVLATGAEQGAYAEFGKRYVTELAKFGIKVELRTTAGAAENRRLLRDPNSGVDIAFMQSGAGDAIYTIDEDKSGRPLLSLGNLFLEPVWLFYRTDAAQRTASSDTLDRLQQIVPLSLNIGAPGSGAANLFDKLLNANKIDPAQMKLQRLPPTPAVVALLGGELDALVFVSAPESVFVRMLLQTPGIRLLEFPQAEAYARRFEFLTGVTMPRGTVDLAEHSAARRAPGGGHREHGHDRSVSSGAGSAVCAGGAANSWRQLMVRARRRVSERLSARISARQGGRSLLPRRAAVPAAISAVLGREPDRSHVGGARVDHRHFDSAVAHRAAAVRVSNSLARVSLVSAAARDRRCGCD